MNLASSPQQQQQWPRGPWNELHDAAKDGSTKRTLALLSSASIDIDQGTPQGFTPLMLAAMLDFSNVVRILLDNGANVSIVDAEGSTALHRSASLGTLGSMKLLVEAGADLDATDSCGYSTLHLAALQQEPAMMSLLIEAGANPNSGMLNEATPLHLAAEFGRADAVKVLLRAKADPLLAVGDPSGPHTLPLDVAAENGHSGVVRELIQQFGIEGCAGSSRGLHALVLAARKQHVDIMSLLMDAGVVDTQATALLQAIAFQGEASVKFLLDRRLLEDIGGSAYANTRNSSNGRTPMCSAISVAGPNSPRIVRMLVDAGADTVSAVRFTDTWRIGPDVVVNAAPLALTVRMLLEKKVAGKDATEKQLHSLEAIRLLLLRVEAVRAVSWLWPSGVLCIVHAAAEDSGRTKATSTMLGAMLPILRRRTRRRGGVLLATAMFR